MTHRTPLTIDSAATPADSAAELDTFEFQARPFSEGLGYVLFATLEGYPPGFRQYYLRKTL